MSAKLSGAQNFWARARVWAKGFEKIERTKALWVLQSSENISIQNSFLKGKYELTISLKESKTASAKNGALSVVVWSCGQYFISFETWFQAIRIVLTSCTLTQVTKYFLPWLACSLLATVKFQKPCLPYALNSQILTKNISVTVPKIGTGFYFAVLYSQSFEITVWESLSTSKLGIIEATFLAWKDQPLFASAWNDLRGV